MTGIGDSTTHHTTPAVAPWRLPAAATRLVVVMAIIVLGVMAPAVAGAEARLEPSQIPVDTAIPVDLILVGGCAPHGGTVQVSAAVPLTFTAVQPTGPPGWAGNVDTIDGARIIQWTPPAPVTDTQVVVNFDALVGAEVPSGTSLPVLVNQACADGTVVTYTAVNDEAVTDTDRRSPEVLAAAALPVIATDGGLGRGSVSIQVVVLAILGVVVVGGSALFILRSLLEE